MKTNYKLTVLLILGFLLSSVVSVNLKIRNLDESSKVLQKEIFVTEKSSYYYAHKVYSDNGKIIIDLVDKDLTAYQFTFESKENTLYYRAAYNKFIIVEEKTSDNKSVSFWVLTITKTEESYTLQNFPVSSLFDNEDYQYADSYLLTDIIEYNEEDQFLYVSLIAQTDYDVYGIDLVKKSQRLITIGWFYISTTIKQKIVGGNSRVLVEATTDTLWFDTRNIRVNNSDPTIYDKVNASSLTTLPIYVQGSEAYSFLSSYFQYVSISSDKLKLTTFIYQGYQKSTNVYAEGTLESTQKPIKIYSDQQTYFLAVSDNDVYASAVYWNTEISAYEIWSGTLSTFLSDETEKSKWLQIFNSAIYVVNYEGGFFIMTNDYFYVLSQSQYYEKQLETSTNQTSDLEDIILAEMKTYLATPIKV